MPHSQIHDRTDSDSRGQLRGDANGSASAAGLDANADIRQLFAEVDATRHSEAPASDARTAELTRNFEQKVAGLEEQLGQPEFAFRPTDRWALVFRQGLAKVDLTHHALAVEVGVGLGANVGWLLANNPSARVIGTDIDERLPELAALRVKSLVGPELARQYLPLSGSNDLLSGLPQNGEFRRKLDLVFGCIPQVKLPPRGAPNKDSVAHYYEPHPELESDPHFIELYSKYDQWDLGLNARLLHQSSTALREDGSIVLNLAGRVPICVLQEMFADYGFKHEILHEAVIPQDPDTDFGQLADDERTSGRNFVFYGEPDASREPMNAAGALLLHNERQTIYHKLYVVRGYLNLH